MEAGYYSKKSPSRTYSHDGHIKVSGDYPPSLILHAKPTLSHTGIFCLLAAAKLLGEFLP